MTKGTGDYEVGYGKPPEHTRFKAGESGNKKGRPKGSRNFKKDLEYVLNGKVTVTDRGSAKKVSSQLATLMRLREKALQGDARSLDRYISLMQEHDAEKGAQTAERELSESEADILDRYVQDQIKAAANADRSEETGRRKNDGTA